MHRKEVMLAGLALSLGTANAQMILEAHPPPPTTGTGTPSGLFFDLTALGSSIAVDGLSTGSDANAGQGFQFELYIRDGTGLGGGVMGPGTSPDGWVLLGTVNATQGSMSGGVSHVVAVPRFIVPAGHTVGVVLVFEGVDGPKYCPALPPYAVYQDNGLRITAGDVRFAPFEVTGLYRQYCVLTGVIEYITDRCYPNCDGSTANPVLNVNDFLCFMSRFAAGDPYANCDQSTMPPVLNVNDFLCFTQQFAGGCS